ncbi:hypothetical protein ACFLSW_01830 [Candidatus Bipolaricaulota bacterium]
MRAQGAGALSSSANLQDQLPAGRFAITCDDDNLSDCDEKAIPMT